MATFIQDLLSHLGYAGIALLMLAEKVFPPIPSEVIMPLAGMQASRGGLSLLGVVAAGTAGATAGNVLWYAAARAVGAERLHGLVERHGRWLTLDWSEVERGRRLFARGGGLFVCLGRMVPTIRSIVSIPAGLLAMPFPSFFLWSLVGTAAWTALLAGAGAALGARYSAVGNVVGTASTVVIVLVVLLLLYVWRVATWRPRG